ncbi:hypothetical protein D9M69_112860 [compost metagenome]
MRKAVGLRVDRMDSARLVLEGNGVVVLASTGAKSDVVALYSLMKFSAIPPQQLRSSVTNFSSLSHWTTALADEAI